jgi:hypothetical protein
LADRARRIVRRKLIIWRLLVGCAALRYWRALHLTWSLVVLAYEFGQIIRRVKETYSSRDTLSRSVFLIAELHILFCGFDPQSEEAERVKQKRLRVLFLELERSCKTNKNEPDLLTVSTVIALNDVIMRREFERLLGFHLSREQARPLALYGSVSQALADFLLYCGCGVDDGFHSPTDSDLAGFVNWAEIRHTRMGTRNAISRIIDARSRFAHWMSVLQSARWRVHERRWAQCHAQEWNRAYTAANDEWRIQALLAARDLDPICQKMARCRIANQMYARAIELVLRLDNEQGNNRNIAQASGETQDEDTTDSLRELSMMDALESLGRSFEAAITT